MPVKVPKLKIDWGNPKSTYVKCVIIWENKRKKNLGGKTLYTCDLRECQKLAGALLKQKIGRKILTKRVLVSKSG